MRAIKALMFATILGSLRAKVFIYVFLIGVGLIAMSIPTSVLAFSDRIRMLSDISVGATSILAIFLSLFFGVNAISGEIEKRTIFNAISKPVSRSEFIVGKFLGVWGTVAISLVGSYVLIEGVLIHQTGSFYVGLLQNLIYSIFEMGLLVALAIFFSSFSKPIFSSFTAAICYALGTQIDVLSYLTQGKPGVMTAWVWLLSKTIPDFSLFNVKTAVAYELEISRWQTFYMMLYAVAYISILILLSSLIFNKRDIK